MNRSEQRKVLGLLALLAFGLHSAQVLGHDHESGFETDCAVCKSQQVTALAAEPSDADLRLPAPAGAVADGALPAALRVAQASHAPRGPPV